MIHHHPESNIRFDPPSHDLLPFPFLAAALIQISGLLIRLKATMRLVSHTWNFRCFCWNDEKMAWERHSNWRHDDTPRRSRFNQRPSTTHIPIKASSAAHEVLRTMPLSTTYRAIVCLKNAAIIRLSFIWLADGVKSQVTGRMLTGH